METENFSLRWNDFEENISSGLKDLRNSNHFFDVTLLSDNGQVGAHKLILSACSSFFREILVSNPHQHPLIYLKGVSKEEIINLLNFMYCGEVNVAQDELSSFLAAAEDLKVKGLTNNGASDINGAKKRKIDTESEINNMKKLKNNLQTDPKKTSEDVPILDVVQVKSEPTTASGDTIAAAPTSKSLAPADYEVEADDFPYDEYQNQDGGFEDDFVSNIGGSKASPHFFHFAGESFPLLPGHVHRGVAAGHHVDQATLRKRRQQILQFINQNKGRMADAYLCLICNKSVTDNSNMNKHLEFKHGEELKAFLSNLA
eukprot:GFUD01034621.1.p1 GENE.GFUD01034621.1~~GFUD01034621.1.p1  ORF type:complete len:315 (+),score=75.00 GFUD01034621.1:240-1184(+)